MEDESGTPTIIVPEAEEEMWPVFLASLSSVGTAAALAASGFYLHRWGYISEEGKKTLGRYSQQVALPALFFSKMVACPPSSSYSSSGPQTISAISSAAGFDPDVLLADSENRTNFVAAILSADSNHDDDGGEPNMCPSIWDSISLRHAWLILMWPFFVVGCGLMVGKAVCWLSQTPARQWGTVMVSVAFANSTGLLTTLLGVLQEHASELWATSSSSSHKKSGGEPQLDPNSVLSLYLVFYPVLHWGLGGWLLSNDNCNNNNLLETTTTTTTVNGYHGKPSDDREETPLLTDVDAEAIPARDTDVDDDNDTSTVELSPLAHRSRGVPSSPKEDTELNGGGYHNHEAPVAGTSTLSCNSSASTTRSDSGTIHQRNNKHAAAEHKKSGGLSQLWLSSAYSCISQTFLKQPPVCGALLGLVVCSWPSLRQIFVGTIAHSYGATSYYSHHPPLKWLLDAIITLGRSAVPINMAVLGANLSIAASPPTPPPPTAKNRLFQHDTIFSYRTILAVVVGKLILMPLIGFFSIRVFLYLVHHHHHHNNGDDGMEGGAPPSPALLVMMMVFLTPTSNTVMLMVDLVDGMKEEMARIMAWQYVFAPFLLSCTVAIAVETARSVT